VYDGLPLPAIPSVTDRRTARDELRLPQDKQIVLFAGQIIERKGVADLLHAWSIVTQRGQSNAELYIVGDDLAGKGAYRCEMQQLAGKLSCPVRFMGFQKYVERWLTACDVVMVPSHVEPLGNATLEAMAHARPVIGGDVGGIPEMVVHDETGLLVPPKSPPQLAAAIVRLLQNREAAVQFGAAARRRCEAMFSLEAHTQSVLAEYDAVLSTAGALSRS
jgi:glycosyltransferase involved in cell wall biosynthesis